jgi:hypothetical protein
MRTGKKSWSVSKPALHLPVAKLSNKEVPLATELIRAKRHSERNRLKRRKGSVIDPRLRLKLHHHI